jgi:hypothetical protein
MARRKASPLTRLTRNALSHRARQLRIEWEGNCGASRFAKRVGVAVRAWNYYEKGRIIPGVVILKLIEHTNVEPMWFFHGRGPNCRGYSHSVAHDLWADAADLIRRALELVEPELFTPFAAPPQPKLG